MLISRGIMMIKPGAERRFPLPAPLPTTRQRS